MKKLTPEEKLARKEEREKARHDELCRNLGKYWAKFFAIFESDEYKLERMAVERAGDIYIAHLRSGVKDPDFKALHAWNEATEEFRCKIVVEKFSSTHNWQPYDMWLRCKDCGYQASTHAWKEGNRYAAVVDKYPHYDMENNLIHYTCAELQERYNERKEKKYRRCKQCGVWGCPHWWETDGSRGNYKI